ncbi:MAG: DUF4339 domain-containing protein [Verrucomicrobiota bacterium]
MSSENWFYAADGTQQGPVGFYQLRTLAQEGTIKPDTLIWREGMENWVKAETVDGVLDEAPASDASPGPIPSNPYAAPSATQITAAVETDFELIPKNLPEPPVKLDLGFCLSQGWKLMKANFVSLFLFGLVYLIILILVSALFQALYEPLGIETVPDPNNPFTPTVISGFGQAFLLEFLSTLIEIFLGLGSARYLLNLISGEDFELSDLFSQGDKVFKTLLATILYFIAVSIGLIFLVVPGIIVAIRLGHYQTVIVERNLGPVEALRFSWQLTRHNVGALLVLGLAAIGIGLVGALALVVGLIPALIVVYCAFTIAYKFLQLGPEKMAALAERTGRA